MKATAAIAAVLLLAIASRSAAQSDGCTLSSTQLTLESFACSEENEPLSASTSTVGPASVETCCPNINAGSDSRRLLDSLMNISKLSMSEARKLQSSDLCRTVQISDAYCDESSTGCNPDDAVLKLDFSFAYEAVASEELCCSACVCWGDPRCTSFDGSRANWIICDDRRAS
eukprot:CAMPEP_0171505256 /NCGR_PEP_ID=MMETSP0958-20121227/12125_1 /TAXON_ID=87120 /ORGANISM="Aurantiochytrium limacinum, Strain ATCCMYA-1381" /LENGTH=171 /DNA_ID=CAMNT_0012041387 /DNA_START=64 /DNA_END=576 /DNA_ORIENTATION=+